MRRRRVIALIGLAALLCGLVLLWRRSQEPPEVQRRKISASKASKRRHPAPHSPAADAPDEPQEEDPRPMAVPAMVDTGAPQPDPVELYTVLVMAVTPEGDPVRGEIVLMSRDCSVWIRAEGGKPVPVRSEKARCTIKAGRRDGKLFAWSDPTQVDMTEASGVVTLAIPEEQTGGLGVAFRVEEGGMAVRHVWPGSPADLMGLSEGDLIVEVDGLPTEALTEDEFISVMTGPVGTEVDFVVGSESDSGWEEEELVLTRGRVE